MNALQIAWLRGQPETLRIDTVAEWGHRPTVAIEITRGEAVEVLDTAFRFCDNTGRLLAVEAHDGPALKLTDEQIAAVELEYFGLIIRNT
jgi:hypothetical protein